MVAGEFARQLLQYYVAMLISVETAIIDRLCILLSLLAGHIESPFQSIKHRNVMSDLELIEVSKRLQYRTGFPHLLSCTF